MSRVDQYQVHLTVAGRDCGTFLTHSGGGVDSEEAFIREGYGLPREALGGPTTMENLTLTRGFKRGRDPELMAFLYGQAGHGRCVANKQLLDADGFAVGKPEIRGGVLKAVKPPDVDIEGSEPGRLTLEISVDGAVSA